MTTKTDIFAAILAGHDTTPAIAASIGASQRLVSNYLSNIVRRGGEIEIVRIAPSGRPGRQLNVYALTPSGVALIEPLANTAHIAPAFLKWVRSFAAGGRLSGIAEVAH